MKIFPFFLLVAAALCVMSCKGGGKKSMKGDEEVNSSDFISFFDEVALPVTFTDSVFAKKANDSALIETKVLHQFLSDTIFKKEFGKTKPKVYSVGRFANGAEETYLILRAVSGSKQALYAATIDKTQKFKASMAILSSTANRGTESVSIDRKYIFTHTIKTKTSDGSIFPVNTVYAYNSAGLFMVILTDGLPAGTDMPIINPIDTLPREAKWTANYGKDKRNFISFRDGVKPQELRFFLHIEKKGETFCDGELKGEARMIGADSAQYTGNGDPCSIGFKFTNTTVTLTENICGNHHGQECTFDGSFTKQKLPVIKPVVKPKEKKKSVKK